jgi:hypothetical protein
VDYFITYSTMIPTGTKCSNMCSKHRALMPVFRACLWRFAAGREKKVDALMAGISDVL